MSGIHKITNRMYDYEQEILIEQADNNGFLILSSGIVELWLSDKPTHNTWSKYSCGVLCLVKNKKRSLNYFRLFDTKGDLLWEQEVYCPFKYKSITKNFHYFPAKEQNAGFNFAFEDEAQNVLDCVIKNFSEFDKEPSSSVQYRNSNYTTNSTSSVRRSLDTTSQIKISFDNNQNNQEVKINYTNKKLNETSIEQKPKERKINTLLSQQKEKAKKFFSFRRAQPEVKQAVKLDISNPNDFRVVQTVKITGDSIKIDAKDDNTKQQIREILSKLNVKQNRKTEQFVGDFLKRIESDSIKKNNNTPSPMYNIKEETESLASYNMNGQYNQPIISSSTQANSIINNQHSHNVTSQYVPEITRRTTILPPKPQVNRNSQISIANLQITQEPVISNSSNSYSSTTEPVNFNQEKSNFNYAEPSMLDLLKNELDKRAQYLNNSDSDDYNSDEVTDSEWN